MKSETSSVLSSGQVFEKKYTIAFFLKSGRYAESYRILDENNKSYFLKLISYALLHRTQFDNDGCVLEVEITKKIKHPNITNFKETGELLINNQKYAYIIFDFISGETLADKMARETNFDQFEAKEIITEVLNGLNYLHSLSSPVIHNELTNLNVMSDMSGRVNVHKIIDFGYARFLEQPPNSFLKDNLNLFYLADEALNKVFTVQSDVFSIGALYYHMLIGMPPWFFEFSEYKSKVIDLEEKILSERQKPLKFEGARSKINKNTIATITKALQPSVEHRFKSTQEFLNDLHNGITLTEPSSNEINGPLARKIKLKNGHGFSSISGMNELKATIQLDIIDALTDKERYEEYGLTIPNGMLLYGPPGCGKTFFAIKMAEEIGFNFYEIKPSDIQSKWVNASQENIKVLFDDARKNAPSIIFIDELDALVPSRDNDGVNHMNTSAVNEFLVQMNNCGNDGVFVIGATNRPHAIDSAILRAGRLDKSVYLPPPDKEARELMFKLYLEKRPCELGIDYQRISLATNNYVSSDIKFLCDEASRNALKNNARITNEILLNVISQNKPSVSPAELAKFVALKQQMDGENITKPKSRMGFI
jgi:transitional endoplasmic reticulum ATPase